MKTLTQTTYSPGSLQAEYRLEREGVHTIEWDDGFVTYSFPEDGVCYIIDIYVRKHMRKSHYAAKMADEVCEIARRAGCEYLVGSVDPSTSGATVSLKVLLGYGMELSHIDEPLIFFKKGL